MPITGSNAIISGPSCAVGRCRFCGITGNSGLLAIGNVCSDEQCQEHASNSCGKTKNCGHACGGVANETKCLPCLQVMCHHNGNDKEQHIDADATGAVALSDRPKLTQDADDMCMICFVEALSCAPAVQLECGHVFHFHCSIAVIQRRWNGPRIGFGFSQCPICKVNFLLFVRFSNANSQSFQTDISHPLLAEVLEPINNLKNDVKRKALMR